MVTTDRQSQQTKHYQDYYQYLMQKAKTAIDDYILGLGLDDFLEEAVKCAISAREYRLEFERVSGFKIALPKAGND